MLSEVEASNIPDTEQWFLFVSFFVFNGFKDVKELRGRMDEFIWNLKTHGKPEEERISHIKDLF